MGRPFTSKNFKLTKAAIAGLVGEMARNFEPGSQIKVIQDQNLICQWVNLVDITSPTTGIKTPYHMECSRQKVQ